MYLTNSLPIHTDFCISSLPDKNLRTVPDINFKITLYTYKKTLSLREISVMKHPVIDAEF
jgi:hypothetical protein